MPENVIRKLMKHDSDNIGISAITYAELTYGVETLAVGSVIYDICLVKKVINNDQNDNAHQAYKKFIHCFSGISLFRARDDICP